MAETYAYVLNGLHAASLPAYVETASDGASIVDVQIPISGRVIRLQPDAKGLTFSLHGVATRFTLPGSAAFDEFAGILGSAYENEAPVLVTRHAITGEFLDIRIDHRPGIASLLPPAAATAAQMTLVTPQRARELFDMMRAQSCDPANPSGTCIPFLYPDHGCQARAHQMCKLIIAAGERPGKIWNFGVLTPRTPNLPECHAAWSFHVAPVLQIGGTAAEPDVLVIDPSLFPEPVPVAAWLEKQRDPNSQFEITSAAPYSPNGALFDYDDTPPFKTDITLSKCRTDLRRLCGANGAPPPPFQQCAVA